jgi:hypothetical protein
VEDGLWFISLGREVFVRLGGGVRGVVPARGVVRGVVPFSPGRAVFVRDGGGVRGVVPAMCDPLFILRFALGVFPVRAGAPDLLAFSPAGALYGAPADLAGTAWLKSPGFEVAAIAGRPWFTEASNA